MRLIDADELFEKVGAIKPRNKEHYNNIGEFMNLITNSPSVKRSGEWVEKEYQSIKILVCSKCGYITGKLGKPYKFCPDCGAKMEVSK